MQVITGTNRTSSTPTRHIGMSPSFENTHKYHQPLYALQNQHCASLYRTELTVGTTSTVHIYKMLVFSSVDIFFFILLLFTEEFIKLYHGLN